MTSLIFCDRCRPTYWSCDVHAGPNNTRGNDIQVCCVPFLSVQHVTEKIYLVYIHAVSFRVTRVVSVSTPS